MTQSAEYLKKIIKQFDHNDKIIESKIESNFIQLKFKDNSVLILRYYLETQELEAQQFLKTLSDENITFLKDMFKDCDSNQWSKYENLRNLILKE